MRNIVILLLLASLFITFMGLLFSYESSVAAGMLLFGIAAIVAYLYKDE